MTETIGHKEREVLRSLGARMAGPSVRAVLDEVVSRVERHLADRRAATMAWEPVPLSIYGEALPGGICSSWVFILRGGAITGAERHPGSRQRMVSYRGAGDLQTRPGETWLSHPLISEPGAPLDRRWISIPPRVWHQAVVPEADWVVVSFHTVAAGDLIEERPDPADPRRTRGRRYLAGTTLPGVALSP